MGRHTIQKQSLEIQFEGFPDTTGIQESIRDTYYGSILPEIEKVFDEIVPEKFRITIDRLEIDCGDLDNRHWQRQLAEEISRQLRKELLTRGKKEIARTSFEDLLLFLESGKLPWNCGLTDLRILEESIKPHPTQQEILRLKQLMQSSPDAARRLVYRFSEQFYNDIVTILSENKPGPIARLTESAERGSGREKLLVRALLLEVIAQDHADPEKALKVALDSEPEDRQHSIPAKSSARMAAGPESLYVENAGIVLLHPFLPELFRRIGLWEEKQWKNPSSRHVAVHALEYLATGQQNAEEPDLSLNKILTGMDIASALEPVDRLEDAIREECDELLREVIRHWSKLKNTSINTIRTSFLQRVGKLTSSEKGWIMVVERKGLDILLDSLPWGIGTIKLPWTEKTIHVEWTY